MPIAQLDISLVARLAELQAGFADAARRSERVTKEIQGHFSGLKIVGVAVGAAIAAALSVNNIAAFVRATVDGIDKLNDLADATGASIENLSGLEDVALRTGTSMDTVGDSVVKLNKLLSDATPGSQQAATLKAIGLSADELRKTDPAEAVLKVAQALAKFADNDHGQKARIIMELFGKSAREVAPFLKDLAEQGRINATLTTEQAQAAEAFNKQLAALAKNSQDVGRSIVDTMLPALTSLLEKLNGGSNTSWLDEQIQKLGKVADGWRLVSIFLERRRLQSVIDLGPDKVDPRNIEAAREQLRLLDEQAKKAAESFGAVESAMWGREGARTATKPNAPGLPDGTAAAALRKRLADWQFAADQELKIEQESFKDKADALDAASAIELAKYEWLQKQLAEGEEEWQRTLAEARKLGVEHQLRQIEQVSEFARTAAESIQNTMGDTLARTLQGDFKGIGDAWRQMLIRMVADASAVKLNEYLFGADFGKTTSNVGGALGELFKWFGGLGGGNTWGAGEAPTNWGAPHANGLSYVPFDGYRAILHKGERVLRNDEARAMDRGAGESGPTIVINANGPQPAETRAQMVQVASEILSRYDRNRRLLGGW